MIQVSYRRNDFESGVHSERHRFFLYAMFYFSLESLYQYLKRVFFSYQTLLNAQHLHSIVFSRFSRFLKSTTRFIIDFVKLQALKHAEKRIIDTE